MAVLPNGYEPASRPAERRAQYDLRRKLAVSQDEADALAARVTTAEANITTLTANNRRVVVRLTDTHSATGAALVTTITWGTEVEDTDGFIGAGGSTITIPTGLGGMYLIELQTTWTTGATSSQAILTVSGRVHKGPSVGGIANVTAVQALAPTSTVVATVYNNNATENVTCSLEMVRVSA